MKKIIFLVIFIYLSAQDFNSFKTNHYKNFNIYTNSLEKEFQEYKKTIEEEFQKYKKEISKYWQKPLLTTKKEFVEYSKDKKIRKRIDFENSKIKIEVIAKSEQEAEQKAKKALALLSIETTKEAFEKNPALKKIENKLKKIALSKPPNNTPIIADVIYKKPPTIKEIKFFTQNSIKQAKTDIKPSKLPDKKVYSYTISLPKKIYLIKAKNLKPIVSEKSKKFALSPALIYAIIETESSYNPMARSYVPAFGLMQIVPQSAGKDAYKMLFGKPKLLSPGYLYNENNNILIGSAYLKKLYYIYFKDIKNPLSRLYLTIAAYNTGPGNVACVFNSTNKDYKGNTLCYRYRGDYSIKKAVAKINALSPQEVYEKLKTDLRYEEARHYIQKVNQKLRKYFIAIKEGKI